VVAREAVIANRLGIHARPATLLVKEAANFEADIFLSKGSIRRINGKSIMGVMMLAAEQGATVLVEAEGPDEEGAAAAIAGLLASSFEEAA
jgi:phosphocarrier protein